MAHLGDATTGQEIVGMLSKSSDVVIIGDQRMVLSMSTICIKGREFDFFVLLL